MDLNCFCFKLCRGHDIDPKVLALKVANDPEIKEDVLFFNNELLESFCFQRDFSQKKILRICLTF